MANLSRIMYADGRYGVVTGADVGGYLLIAQSLSGGTFFVDPKEADIIDIDALVYNADIHLIRLLANMLNDTDTRSDDLIAQADVAEAICRHIANCIASYEISWTELTGRDDEDDEGEANDV